MQLCCTVSVVKTESLLTLSPSSPYLSGELWGHEPLRCSRSVHTDDYDTSTSRAHACKAATACTSSRRPHTHISTTTCAITGHRSSSFTKIQSTSLRWRNLGGQTATYAQAWHWHAGSYSWCVARITGGPTIYNKRLMVFKKEAATINSHHL